MGLKPDPKPADQRLKETTEALKAIRIKQQAQQQGGKK